MSTSRGELPRALILAGGRGLRLQPFTFSIPKPLIPLGERAMLEILVRQLLAAGVPRIFVALNYLARLIRVYLRNLEEQEGIHCACLQEDEPLGTAGAMGLLPAEAEATIVCNADVLTDLRWADLLAFHHREGADLTIAGVRHVQTLPYGSLQTDEQTGFQGWSERQTLCRLVSAGIYVAGPRAVGSVVPGERIDMPELARRVREGGGRVAVFEHAGTWFDVGDWPQYERAAAAFASHPELFVEPFVEVRP